MHTKMEWFEAVEDAAQDYRVIQPDTYGPDLLMATGLEWPPRDVSMAREIAEHADKVSEEVAQKLGRLLFLQDAVLHSSCPIEIMSEHRDGLLSLTYEDGISILDHADRATELLEEKYGEPLSDHDRRIATHGFTDILLGFDGHIGVRK